MLRSLTPFIASMALVAGLSTHDLRAQEKADKARAVSGKWTMTVSGNPHGATTMGLTLKQEGKVVTGSFDSPHGEVPVKGEFIDRTLTLATTSGSDTGEITFNAKLNADDTLTGYLSSSRGDMTWTATREKEKAK